MSEIELMRAIQLRASEMGHRLFRNNIGNGWVGGQIRVSHSQLVMVHPGDIVLRGARVLHAGLAEGSSDLIGLTTVQIKEPMLGNRVAVFTALEVKSSTGKTAEVQQAFIDKINSLGGIAAVVKSNEEAEQAMRRLQ